MSRASHKAGIAEPEILPPSRDRRAVPEAAAGATAERVPGAPSRAFDDEHLDLLSHLLDDFIRIPGTPIRFGLDGIVGFIPGIGDVIGGLASTYIIFAAWKRGIPKVTVARMVLNVAIETAAGAVPMLGNLFDIGWKANRRNYALLRGSLAPSPTGAHATPQRESGSSWLFLAGVCVVLALLMIVPVLLLGWLLAHVGHTILGFDLHRLGH